MFYYQEQNSLKIGTKELFKEFTGADWLDEMYLESPFEPELLRPSCKEDLELMHLFLPAYNLYCKHGAKLYVKKGTSTNNHALFAREPIAKATVVCEYLGLWSPKSNASSSYRWGPIDAAFYRNYAALVEDGFPNVMAVYLYNVKNIPLRVIFVALDDIKENEMITIHYGMNHSVKSSYHTEYRLQAMIDFFQKNPLETIIKHIKADRSKSPKTLGLKKSLRLESLITKLRYVYQTPSAFMHLVKENVIKFDEAISYFQQIDFRYIFLGFSPTPYKRQQEIISYFEVMKEYFQKFSEMSDQDFSMMSEVQQKVFYSVFLKSRIQDESYATSREKAVTSGLPLFYTLPISPI